VGNKSFLEPPHCPEASQKTVFVAIIQVQNGTGGSAMKMLSVTLVAVVAVVLIQTVLHDCHWRGTERLEQWVGCVLALDRYR